MKNINVNMLRDDGEVITIKKETISVCDSFDKPSWCRFCVETESAYYFYDLYPFSDIMPPSKLITLGKKYNERTTN